MASFGKVLDLLDDRYLELQDVVGNVEPLPTLVPYKEYTKDVLVYRMDSNLNLYMAVMQEFTERRARETSRELWTWCAQWEVEAASYKQTVATPSSPKKPRLQAQQLEVHSQPQTEQPQTPCLNIVERRVLDPRLLRQDDMLRCLIDIVQVESTLVPNFIEFLYRWIDFYSGDGKALKAAMRWEIPSLWEFEYHPLVLPQAFRSAVQQPDKGDIDRAVHADTGNSSPDEDTEELETGTKQRTKPDLAALEYEVEMSERLQYREVHYGIKPPKLTHPIPRLINIPRAPKSRVKYYAACFKSRQRAFNLLLEAGLTVQQIRNYKKQQVPSARDTPRDGQGNGLRHYEKDAKAAQAHYVKKEKDMAVRAKHMEIAISNRLAVEARVAARSNVTAGPTGVPLIPATPSYAPRPVVEVDILERLQIGQSHGRDKINVVPKPLVGKLKSKLFEGAKDTEWLKRLTAAGGMLHLARPSSEDLGREESGASDDDGNEEEDVPVDTPLSQHFATPPVNTMQVLADTATIPQSTADEEPWNPQQIANFVDSLTPAQRRVAIHLMGPRYITMADNTGPPSINATPVAERSMSSALTSAPSPINTSWTAAAMHVQQPMGLFPLPPTPFSTSAQTPMGQPPLQSPPSFGRQITTTLPIRPSISTSYSDVASGASQPPSQRRISSDPASLSYLLTLGSGGPMQRNNAQSSGGSHQQQHPLAPRPSLPQLPRLPSVSPLPPLPPLPQLSVHPPTPRLQPPSSAPARAHPQITAPNSHQVMAASPNFWNIPQPFLQTPTRPFQPSLPRAGISRASQPPMLSLPSNPLSDLSPKLGSVQPQASPFASTQADMPILIHLPKVIRPGNTLGPNGVALGDNGVRETDVLLLGNSVPGSGKIVLSRAIFLPMGVWENVCRRAQVGGWKILETYSAGLTCTNTPIPGNEKTVASHKAVYTKLEHAYSIISTSRNREAELTKRWRSTRGPMTHADRGSVWEGWGVTLDKGIEMNAQEREGAIFFSGMIDEGLEQKSVSEEVARQRREIERLLAEDEEDITDAEDVTDEEMET